MTRIKICGITNVEDALAAVEYGADALGFICVPESPRFVTDERLLDLVSCIPPFITRVGVYADLSRFSTISARCFHVIQTYSNVRPADHLNCILAVRVRSESSLYESELAMHLGDAILLDTYNSDRLGGSGETFNWEIARAAKDFFQHPIILAGGLTPDNVREAIRRVRPYAVDVSSGVESSPGRKDHSKLKAFIQAVRAADRED